MTTPLIHRFCAKLLAFVILTSSALAAEVVPVLRTKSETYKNVTLVSRTGTHVFVKHTRGVANIKMAELDAEMLRDLGVLSEAEFAAATAPQPTRSETALASLGNMANSLPESWKSRAPSEISLPPVSKNALLVALVVFALFYLFFSYCAMLICQKAGSEPGVLIWLPILQIYPMIRAAGMSGWWFLGWFVPVVNIVAQVFWCVKIARARGKGVLTTIMLILPVTSLFAFLYLAFSNGSAPDSEEDRRPLRLDPLPA